MRINKLKILFLVIVLALLGLTSCGNLTKKPVVPRYRFEIGVPLQYKLKGKIAVTIDAGLLKYDGNVDFTADVEMLALETNERGTKIQFDIRNPDIQGANTQIMAAFYMGLNYVRTWLGSFYMTDAGKTSVYYNNQPVVGLNSYAQVLYPDFTDMAGLNNGMSETTNFPARLQKMEYTMTFNRNWGIKNTVGDDLNLYQKLKFLTYNKADFDKTVDPATVGTVFMDGTDIFDTAKGQLRQKTGKLQFTFNLPLNEGLFSYIIALQGNGEFIMEQVKKP